MNAVSDVIATVDVVLLTLSEGVLHVALQKRDRDPYKGLLALPGGYIHANEDADAEAAAVRMLRDKTGIVSPYLEQLSTFSGPARDPRGWSLSVAYYALVSAGVIDASVRRDVELHAADTIRNLPFDHKDIIAAAVARVRSKSSYSSLPVYLCDETFTLPQLQGVYEAILGESLNKVSFRRRLDELDMLEPVAGAMETGKAHRPAQLYRLKKQYRSRLSLSGKSLG